MFNSLFVFLLKNRINSADKLDTILLEKSFVIGSPNNVIVYGILIIVVGAVLYK